MNKTIIKAVSYVLALSLCIIGGAAPAVFRVNADDSITQLDKLRSSLDLTWSDEFDGTTLDTSKWGYEGRYVRRNSELQVYCDTPEEGNVYLEEGNLVIEARKESRHGYDYTSGSIHTRNLKTFQYGVIEMRAKLPFGQGVWPAFWMLGVDSFGAMRWPDYGELDIMEMIGKEPSTVYGNAHVRSSGGDHIGSGGRYYLKTGNLSDDYHTYGVMWTENEIVWFFDDITFHTVETSGDYSTFDEYKAYIILNLAIGGSWPGSPNADTVFPSRYYVDYVRVYNTRKPIAEKVTDSAITVKSVDGYEYSLDKTNWQKSCEFAGLNADSEYKIYQRYAGTGTVAGSEISEPLTVTTSEFSGTTEPTSPTEPTQPTAAVKYGDANGDGSINAKDVLLIRKYIAKHKVSIDVKAADAVCDGKINAKDVLLIRKYIAKYKVTLGK